MAAVYDVEAALRRLGIGHERRGRRWWIRCPRASNPRYHERGDVDWSCSIMPSEEREKCGLFYCHSCKLAGNLPQLVAIVLGLKGDFMATPYKKGCEWLAKDVLRENPIVTVKVVAGSPRRKRFVLPQGVVVDKPLDRWPEHIRKYVAEERGITAEQVRRWGIGYAVDGDLTDRVVLITRDASGRPVNYSARSAKSFSKKRYLMADTKENPDRTVLFGEQHWSSGGDTVVVSEGAFDALAVERVLPEGVSIAALSGSNVTPLVIAKLSKFRRIVVATDDDGAGRGADAKLRGSFVRHADYRRLFYPAGEDANSLPVEERRRILEVVLAAPTATPSYVQEVALRKS